MFLICSIRYAQLQAAFGAADIYADFSGVDCMSGYSESGQRKEGFDMFGWEPDDLDGFDFKPLKINKELSRGKAPDWGDLTRVTDALDAVGSYDKGKDGNPPLVIEKLFAAIEDFQQKHGLEVDGVIQPYGPTVNALNETLPRVLPRPIRRDFLQSDRSAGKSTSSARDGTTSSNISDLGMTPLSNLPASQPAKSHEIEMLRERQDQLLLRQDLKRADDHLHGAHVFDGVAAISHLSQD